MKKLFYLLIMVAGIPVNSRAQTIEWNGTAIGWATANPADSLQVQAGLRYLPELTFSMPVGSISLEAKAAANMWISGSVPGTDTLIGNSSIEPYRGWIKLSGNQFEVRAGLQKINFGSAQMLRPLMWFDRIDPRDPLQLTDGVYGLLGRYYFLNNANIWLWGLYGNDHTKGMEIYPSPKKKPEWGGRVQLPLWTGEIAGTYHHRKVSPDNILPDSLHTGTLYNENRVALDGKFNMLIGLWFEGMLTHQNLDFSPYDYKTLLNGGADYTFGVGNGLTVTGEWFSYLTGEQPFAGDQSAHLAGISATYPMNIIHNLNAILFYDITNRNFYRFVNWTLAYDRWTFHLMGFWNPETYELYTFRQTNNLFGGWGLQFMAVFNH